MKTVTFLEADQREHSSVPVQPATFFFVLPQFCKDPLSSIPVLSDPYFCTDLSLNLPFIPFPLSSLFVKVGR